MATLIANQSNTLGTAGKDSTSQQTRTGLNDRIKWILAHAITMYSINAERRELAKLTDGQLRDIGISRSQAQEECNRAVFDVPQR